MALHISSKQSAMAEINVTPLVDVMLVLLIVFIVTAPLLMQAVKIDLPRTAQVAPLKETQTAQLAIDAQGTVHIDQRAIHFDALENELRKMRAANPELAFLRDHQVLHLGHDHGGLRGTGTGVDR